MTTSVDVIEAGRALTEQQRGQLTDCEREIESAFDTMRAAWRTIGRALACIHTGKLYREWCDTFDEYLDSRWGYLPRSTAWEWMQAAGVVTNIEHHASAYAVVIDPPTHRQHAIQLARLPAEQQAEALTQAREMAAERGTAVTTFDVKRVVTARLGEPAPRTTAETAHAREMRTLMELTRRTWRRLDDESRAVLLAEFAATSTTE